MLEGRETHEEGGFISPIFLGQKLVGEYCFILNLKQLNQIEEYKKLKIETCAARYVHGKIIN